MRPITVRIFILVFPFALGIACQSPSIPRNDQSSSTTRLPDTISYRGNLSSASYDSIVNQLVLFENQTFDLHQFDRIAEHHLNDREHTGIYAYLKDSTQLGLYSDDGVLMLRFLLSGQDLIPMALDGSKILDSSLIWKRQHSVSH
ncbi:hypothetical protein KUV50_12085 [Membranicola marinus]|uniref:Uncharacterized protein n=1 Tax=Membranihabitans marinus TaxID=1227546 RepID=A0A953HVD0_9BACT|nr:hypothetical protein [Membranihabitans marinus]MBY5958881.1 hypothetical protein [Membranihabitans marinus]